MVVLSKGEYVWLKPSIPNEFGILIGAKIVGIKDGKFEIVDDEGNRRVIGTSDVVQLMHKSVAEGTEDMINLGDLNESAILRNLYIRYKQDAIYTYTGSILVAINPYKKLPIYEKDTILMYQNKNFNELPPHIYAVADNAYRDMINFDRNQTVIISGESGSGKTETTKYMLKFLTQSSGQHTWIEQQVLDSNPILEAFGNAKTVRNDNSSRFGKYIDIEFDMNGHIVKAKIYQYLLEKSRIIGQTKGERNYHIFYCMLAGLVDKEKQELLLEPKENYNYLRQDSYVVETRDDLSEWNIIRTAFKIMLFSEQHVMELMKILALFLHIGQTEFEGNAKRNDESIAIKSMKPVEKASTLLQVDSNGLKKALTQKTISVSNQTITTTLSKEQAVDIRDTFVKSVYGKMFEWLVDEINKTITKDSVDGEKSFGILDIFGFENMETNSFEQLCINYTNERLQQFFVEHVFKLEQREYELENINWQKIQFVDNKDIVDFMALKKMNLFALIDEETIFPKGTDATLVRKIYDNHGKSKCIEKSKGNNPLLFTIHHFAGDVTYNAKHFLEKNRDTFSADFKSLLLNCGNKLIKEFFGDTLDEKAAVACSFKAFKIWKENAKSKHRTLGGQFKVAMESLMLMMSERHPSFVRCIKPNENKASADFDRNLITRQLLYSGMMETIKIRRAGFPIRHTINDFVLRYHLLLKTGKPITPDMDKRTIAMDICKKVLNESLFELGKTKVFLKDAGNSELEASRHSALSESIVDIQGMIRNWASKRIFNRIREAATKVQNFWKNSTEQRNYAKLRRGFMRLQAIPLSKLTSDRYYKLLQSTPTIQEECREYLLKNYVLPNFLNILLLQQAVKRYISTRKLVKEMMHYNDIDDANRMKKDIERKLTRTLGADKGKLEAEKRYTERMSEIDHQHELLNEKDESEKQRKNELIKSLTESRHWLSFADMEIDKAFKPIFDSDISSRRRAKQIIEDEELEHVDFKFNQYAKEHFQANQTPRHQKEMLSKPLLKLPNRIFDMIALSCWMLLQQFMDAPDSTKVKSRLKDYTIMEFVLRNYASLLRLGDDDEVAERADAFKDVMTDGRLAFSLVLSVFKAGVVKHRSYMIRIHSNIKPDDEKSYISAGFLPKVRLTPFEIIQFWAAVGILLPEIRNELYCQVLKQLTSNESVESFAKGWVMLSFMVGIFPPGDDALKAKKPLQLSVTTMDDNAVSIYVDSTTIGKEAVMSIAAKLKINDIVGFGIRASVFNVSDIVNENDHIMDIISLCEEYAIKVGVPVRSTPLRLVLQKSYFPPWVVPTEDTMAVKLIYAQFIRGLKYGEYNCDDMSERMYYAAQIYYANVGPKVTVADLEAFMPKVVPDEELLVKKNRKRCTEIFRGTFSEMKPHMKNTYGDSLEGRELLKAAIVDNMRYRWPTKFSRFFYGVDLTSPALTNEGGELVVTWKSINYLKNKSILLVLDYPEIISVSEVTPHEYRKNMNSFAVHKPNVSYTFSLERANVLRNLLADYIKGLKERSNYALAIKDYVKEGRGKGALALRRGDLITLYNNEEDLDNVDANNDLYFGENDRNGKEGYFPKECVYVIPTSDKPTSTQMDTLSILAFKAVSDYMIDEEYALEIFPAWERFAKKHFRKSSKKGWSRKDDRQMVHQKDPMRRPLLSAIEVDEDDERVSALADQALKCFRAILRYERLPQKGYKATTCQEIVDSIFGPCLRETKQEKYTYLLKQEVYCQIIKQLMRNDDAEMARRVWELLWLAIGLFLPNKELHIVLSEFLKSLNSRLADAFIQRMKKLSERKQRKMPPTLIEIDSIQKKALRMFHQVSLPDQSEERVTVDSLSTTGDIEKQLSQKLKLTAPDEFSVIVRMKTTSKSIARDYYLFDYVREMTDELLKRTKNVDKRDIHFAYELLYIRKLWINMVPGDNIHADIIFHYPQETQKYLRGYYDVSDDDVIDIAVLIYIGKFGNDPSKFDIIVKDLSEYIPKDVITKHNPEEWVNKLEEAFEETEEMSKDEAKLQVLRILYQYPQFATTFVDVKQNSNSDFPNSLTIGLNKKGINIINPQTKETLLSTPYSKHVECRVSPGLFHLTLNPTTTILCETNAENKLEELLKGYKERLSSEDEEDETNELENVNEEKENKTDFESIESDNDFDENPDRNIAPESSATKRGNDLERKLEELRRNLNASRKTPVNSNANLSTSMPATKPHTLSTSEDKYSEINEADI